jgi:cell division protein FtsB
MDDLSVFVKGWQAAIAGLILAVLYGFKTYLSTRKDLREDKAGESTSNAYGSIITSLREENDRLILANNALRAENELLHQQIIRN